MLPEIKDKISSAFGEFTNKGSDKILLKKAYTNIFGEYPSEILMEINDEKKIYDLLNIGKEDDIFCARCDVFFKREKVSCAENDRDYEMHPVMNVESIGKDDVKTGEHGGYEYGSYYNAGEQHDPCLVIVDPERKIIYLINRYGIDIYYSGLSDLDGKTPREYSEKFAESLPKIKREAVDEDNANVRLVLYDNGFYTESAAINSTKIDLDNNYNDDFGPIYKKLEEFITNGDRKSGIVILNGEPGTGKTMLIRHLVTNIKKNYIFIPPGIASRLSDPEFIGFMISNKDSIFIMEDCESVVAERDSNIDFASTVSAILNISDGLMSDIFNIKFICTFNMDIKRIDPAILRPGRCFVNYEFGKLSKEKTGKLMKKLGNKWDGKEMTVSEIYNWNKKAEGGKEKEKKIGF